MNAWIHVPVKENGKDLIVFDSSRNQLQILRNGVVSFRKDNEDLDLMSSVEEVNVLVESYKDYLSPFEYRVILVLVYGDGTRAPVLRQLNSFESADRIVDNFFRDSAELELKVVLGVMFMDGINEMAQITINRDEALSENNQFSTKNLYFNQNSAIDRDKFYNDEPIKNQISKRIDFINSFVPPPPVLIPTPPLARMSLISPYTVSMTAGDLGDIY